MGYNSQCFSQNCNYNCCGFSGFCVSSPNNCYYYYHDQNNIGVIIGAIVGGLIGVALIIILCVYCYRRRRQAQMQEEIMRQNRYGPNQNPNSGTNINLHGYGPNNPHLAHGHIQGNQYGQPINGNPIPPPPPYGKPIGQPAYFGQAPNNNATNYNQPVYPPPAHYDEFAL